MHISIHGDVNTCVAKYLAQTLDIESKLNAPRGKRVTECMEIYIVNIALFSYCFEAILHVAGFHIAMHHSCKQIRLILLLNWQQELTNFIRDWNPANRVIALRRHDDYFGLFPGTVFNLYTLHGLMNIQALLVHKDIFPCQSTYFSIP